MNHITLTNIKRQLQILMDYPLEHLFEDDEYMTLDEAFEELLDGFDKMLKRNKLASRTAVYDAIKRGWMTEKLADQFTEYIIPGWRII